jgi:hypothetical protein
MFSLNLFEIITSLLTTLGLGGILGAFFQFHFQHQKEVKADIHELKRQRYGAILIQMLTILDPEHGLSKTQKFRLDLKNIEDFKEEVKIEMLNGVLFASDKVIKAMAEFIRNPNQASYIKTVVSMRKYLWGKRTKISENTLDIFHK